MSAQSEKCPRNDRKGFTLIELLVVISIIAILSVIGITVFSGVQKNARDSRRLADMKAIFNALAMYQIQNGTYPAVNPAAQGDGGWEVSDKTGFLSSLIPGYLQSAVVDPINKRDAGFWFFTPGSYFYAYYFYPLGSSVYYGCDFNEPFAVIAIRQLENGKQSNTPKAHCGTDPPGGCTGGGIANTCRDWSTEFDYSQILHI